jgi:hypothetical protein
MDFQIRLFLIAFAIRFAMAIVIYQFGLVNVLGDEDSSGWRVGVLIMEKWQADGVGLVGLPGALLQAFRDYHRGYFYLLALLFHVTGLPGRMPAAALNCFFGALTVIFAYRIARSLFPERVAERAGWLACFFPSLIVWSAQTLKEPIVILLETAALYGCVQLRRHGFRLRHIALCAAATLLLLPFRFYAMYITLAAVFLTLALPHFGRRKLTLGPALGLGLLVVSLVWVTGVSVVRDADLQRMELKNVEKFKMNVTLGPGARSGVVQNYDLHSPTGFVMATAVGATYLLLAPMPWHLGGGSLRMLLSGPEMVFWWWLFFAGAAPGFWFLLRKRFSDVLPLMLFTGGLGLLYSLTFGNIGLVFRQRAQLLPWLLVFAAVGLELRRLKREQAAEARREAQAQHYARVYGRTHSQAHSQAHSKTRAAEIRP